MRRSRRLPLLALALLSALGAAGAAACGGEKSPTNPDTGGDSAVVTLTVVLSEGIVGTPSGTGPYPKGFTVSYSYNALPGYQGLQVTLDGNPIAASGTFAMTGARRLAVNASRIQTAAAAPR